MFKYTRHALLLLVLLFGTAPRVDAASILWGIDNGPNTLVTVNTGTGAVATIGSLGVDWIFGGLDFDSSGNLYAINSIGNTFYSINALTGAATLIGATGAGGVLESFEIIGGVGYTQDVFTNNLYSINLATGAATLIGGYSGGRVTGLASDEIGLYGTRIFEEDIVRLNTATGAIAANVGVHGIDLSVNLAFAEGLFWTISVNDGNLYSLAFGNAAPTLAFSSLGFSQITGLTARPAAVPEPATLLLLGSGLGAVAARRRARKRA